MKKPPGQIQKPSTWGKHYKHFIKPDWIDWIKSFGGHQVKDFNAHIGSIIDAYYKGDVSELLSHIRGMDEIDKLECKYCDEYLDLRETEPENEGWTLIGFGVWYCPDCHASHMLEIQANANFFRVVSELFSSEYTITGKANVYDILKCKWSECIKMKHKLKEYRWESM